MATATAPRRPIGGPAGRPTPSPRPRSNPSLKRHGYQGCRSGRRPQQAGDGSVKPRYTRRCVHDHLGLDGDRAGTTSGLLGFDATFRIATALVQDGMTGVTVIIPRQPGVLSCARAVARLAGISLRAEDVGSATITMRFSAQQSGVAGARGAIRSEHRRVWQPGVPDRGRWARLFSWFLVGSR